MLRKKDGGKRSKEGCDRYRLILQNVRDFAIFSADLTGKINEWNPGAERFFGYTEQEVLGQPMELLYVPEDRAAGRAELEKAQAAQTGFSEDERWHLRKDGTRFFVCGVVNAMYDDTGALCGFIKVARDVTVRHVTRLELERARQELEGIRNELQEQVARRTKSLEQTAQSLEEVLYHVAHDLRAPLRTMEGFSSILVEKHGRDAESEHLGNMISESAQRMDRLIHDLLIYGRLCHEPVSRKELALTPIIESALAVLSAEVSRAKGQIEVEQPLPKVWGDPHVIRRVFCQLIGNALSFVAPGRPPQVRIRAEPRQDFVRVWIEDNGVGIPPEHLDRIFRMFERLSQAGANTGMGLPIARKGMERMEGRIGVESSPGKGSRFWIELSAAEGSQQ